MMLEGMQVSMAVMRGMVRRKRCQQAIYRMVSAIEWSLEPSSFVCVKICFEAHSHVS
jgi:hypothetical protein